LRPAFDNGRRGDSVLLRSKGSASEGYLIVFSFAEAQSDKPKDDCQSEESVDESQLAYADSQEFLVWLRRER